MIKYIFLTSILLLYGCSESPSKATPNDRIDVKKECPMGSHKTARGMIDEGIAPYKCVKDVGVRINNRTDTQIRELGKRNTNPFGYKKQQE